MVYELFIIIFELYNGLFFFTIFVILDVQKVYIYVLLPRWILYVFLPVLFVLRPILTKYFHCIQHRYFEKMKPLMSDFLWLLMGCNFSKPTLLRATGRNVNKVLIPLFFSPVMMVIFIALKYPAKFMGKSGFYALVFISLFKRYN